MYLADSLRLAASGVPEGSEVCATPMVAYTRMRAREILETCELFAFTRSALAVAADLRVDTPERLEAIAEAVLRRPRRVFLEAPHLDRRDMLSTLRGFVQTDLPAGRYDPARVGLDIDCKGDGRARISSIWSFGRASISRRERRLLEGLGRTRLERDAIGELLRLGTTVCSIDVDLSRSDGLSLEAFNARLAAGDPEARTFCRVAGEMLARGPRGPGATERDRIFEGWRAYRLNQVSTMAIDNRGREGILHLAAASGRGIDAVMTDAERDLDGEVVYALAMLAALEIEGREIRRKERAAVSGRGEGRRVSRRDIDTDRLAVLSLDISDRAMMREIEKGAAAGRGDPGKAVGGKRVRHPVRGHLFRARNGKIVYRKPHWRGGRIARTITRVR